MEWGNEADAQGWEPSLNLNISSASPVPSYRWDDDRQGGLLGSPDTAGSSSATGSEGQG